ncbi:hypothetical protein GLOIN_2v221147 [Rhizophagus clarus]|uniref:Uncharacterized protein n=1 Tax=Rhizophagus clarus TaxID=94130 RepID=A0A8H3LM40_9GLOM|nr:hypothetical protein GLOIN_2v221147 [Rhizophagus clarus]
MFNSLFSTVKVKQFIKDLEYHEEAWLNVTFTYTATVLKDQQENQKLIDQLREIAESSNGKQNWQEHVFAPESELIQDHDENELLRQSDLCSRQEKNVEGNKDIKTFTFRQIIMNQDGKANRTDGIAYISNIQNSYEISTVEGSKPCY